MDLEDYNLGDLTGVVDEYLQPPVVVTAQASLDIPEMRMQPFVVDAKLSVKSCQESEALARAATDNLQTFFKSISIALQVCASVQTVVYSGNTFFESVWYLAEELLQAW